MSRRKIALVALTSTASGTERVLSDIALELCSHGENVSVLLPQGNDALDRFAARLQDAGVDVHRIYQPYGRRNVARTSLQFASILRQIGSDLIHFHCPSYSWGGEAIIAAALMKTPVIIRTEHNPLMTRPTGIGGGLLAIGDRKVDVFTYVSAGNQARYEDYLPRRKSRGRVIANGIDPEKFAPQVEADRSQDLRSIIGATSDDRIAVYLGHFGEGARRPISPICAAFHQLLRAPRSAKIAGNWHLVIIGGGDQAPVEACWRDALGQRMHFLGQRADVASLLSQADLWLSASHFEGMCISMLEAWACGLPVLITPVDGVTDVVGEPQAGCVIVPHRDIEGYAKGWFEIMRDLDAHRSGAQRISQKVRREFTTRSMIHQYLALYDELMVRSHVVSREALAV